MLLYSSAENVKERVHISYKTKYGNEIGNPEFILHVHNTGLSSYENKGSVYMETKNTQVNLSIIAYPSSSEGYVVCM